MQAPLQNVRIQLIGYCAFVIGPWLVFYALQTIQLGQLAEETATTSVGFTIIGSIVLIVFYAAFAVLVHRSVAGVSKPWQLGRSTVEYIFATIYTLLLVSVPYAVFMWITWDLFIEARTDFFSRAAHDLISGAFFAAISARLILALPAAALGRDKPIRRSVRITREHSVDLFLGVFFTTSVVALLGSIASYYLVPLVTGCPFTYGASPEDICAVPQVISVLMPITSSALAYFFVVFSVSFLTHAFLALDVDDPFDLPEAEMSST